MTRRTAPVVRHLPEIGVTVISKWLFNCYVIHDGGDGRPFVVDVGMPSQLPLVADTLRADGAHLTDLGAAVATHGHADHVGGLPALRARAATPTHLPVAIDDMRGGAIAIRPPGLRAVAEILPVLASQPRDLGAALEIGRGAKEIGWDGSGVRLPFEPESWLADGQTLPGLPSWQVLTTPGHSDDSTCLFHEPTRTLLSGDAVLSANGRAWFNPELVDPSLSDATEARLRALDVEHLLPGHGPILTGPRVMAEAVSHRQRASAGEKASALWNVLRNHANHH